MKHRRRLSSRSSVNGGDSSGAVVRSNALCDHLYATTCESLVVENMQLREMVVSHLDIIGQLQEELASTKTRQVSTTSCPLLSANDHKLAARVVRRDRRMCLVRCQDRTPPVLATRYFGRKSKTIPSRALKRRYMGPPKTVLPSKVPPPPAPLVVKKEEEAPPPPRPREKRLRKEEEAPPPTRERRSRKEEEKKTVEVKKEEAPAASADYLTTDQEYFPLPTNENSSTPVEEAAPSTASTPQIDVPSWKLKPVTSFYQMEGTENINDDVYERRHQKYELDERRRKRWDLQRLREQRARTERQRRKDKKKEEPTSFYPEPLKMEAIEITDQLPVVAFGCPIPVLKPCDFSLPWLPEAKKKGRRGRPPSKVT